jgi:hypothetical protein
MFSAQRYGSRRWRGEGATPACTDLGQMTVKGRNALVRAFRIVVEEVQA